MGSHLGLPAMATRCCRRLRKVDDGETPAMLRRRRGDDDAQEDEAMTMARSTWSGTARNGVEVRPEEYRTPARVRVAGDVDLLCEKKNEGHQRVRTGERRRVDHKVVAQTHCVVAGESKTAAETSDSGEQ